MFSGLLGWQLGIAKPQILSRVRCLLTISHHINRLRALPWVFLIFSCHAALWVWKPEDLLKFWSTHGSGICTDFTRMKGKITKDACWVYGFLTCVGGNPHTICTTVFWVQNTGIWFLRQTWFQRKKHLDWNHTIQRVLLRDFRQFTQPL